MVNYFDPNKVSDPSHYIDYNFGVGNRKTTRFHVNEHLLVNQTIKALKTEIIDIAEMENIFGKVDAIIANPKLFTAPKGKKTRMELLEAYGALFKMLAKLEELKTIVNSDIWKIIRQYKTKIERVRELGVSKMQGNPYVPVRNPKGGYRVPGLDLMYDKEQFINKQVLKVRPAGQRPIQTIRAKRLAGKTGRELAAEYRRNNPKAGGWRLRRKK